MRLETVRIHFLSDVFGLLSSRNFATMATWRDDFSSLLYDQNANSSYNFRIYKTSLVGRGRNVELKSLSKVRHYKKAGYHFEHCRLRNIFKDLILWSSTTIVGVLNNNNQCKARERSNRYYLIGERKDCDRGLWLIEPSVFSLRHMRTCASKVILYQTHLHWKGFISC